MCCLAPRPTPRKETNLILTVPKTFLAPASLPKWIFVFNNCIPVTHWVLPEVQGEGKKMAAQWVLPQNQDYKHLIDGKILPLLEKLTIPLMNTTHPLLSLPILGESPACSYIITMAGNSVTHSFWIPRLGSTSALPD